MEGTLSDRIKKILNNPEKIALLMEYLRDPEKRKDIEIYIKDEEIIIENKRGKHLSATS